MMTGLKELKSWVSGIWQPGMATGEEDYRNLEYTVERHLHNPQPRNQLTYEQEARIKSVKYQ